MRKPVDEAAHCPSLPSHFPEPGPLEMSSAVPSSVAASPRRADETSGMFRDL